MLSDFVCARYQFDLQAVTPVRLSAFAGATLRGGFGHVFKRTVCIWPPADCPRCLLKNTCSYPYIFETKPPPTTSKLRNLDQIPRPFVLEPPEGEQRQFGPGESFSFRLVLVGRSIDYLPYFLFTFTELGRTGLGPGRGQYQVMCVQAEGLQESQCIYTATESNLRQDGPTVQASQLLPSKKASSRLTLHFLTPARIKSEGSLQTEISFQDLIRALLRRLSSLCYFHCGCALQLDFRELIEQAAAVRTVSSELHWQGQERFSSRQQQWIPMGGLLGSVTFAAPDPGHLEPFWPLLCAGEWVHIGKGCVMGMGKYQLEF